MKLLFNYFSILSFFALSLGITSICFASEPEYTEMVEVEESVSVLESYKVRRGESGALFSIEYLKATPEDYLSTIENVSFVKQYGGNSLSGFGVSLLKKLNWKPASLAIGPSYGMLSVASGANSMTINQLGLQGKLILDGVYEEPHWAPFVSGELWNISISEKSATKSFNGVVDYGYSWRAGLQAQLDRLDPSAASAAILESGIQSTFLSMWIGAIGSPFSTEDPALETQPEFGAALTLEY
jgi:hypothetical protein